MQVQLLPWAARLPEDQKEQTEEPRGEGPPACTGEAEQWKDSDLPSAASDSQRPMSWGQACAPGQGPGWVGEAGEAGTRRGNPRCREKERRGWGRQGTSKNSCHNPATSTVRGEVLHRHRPHRGNEAAAQK